MRSLFLRIFVWFWIAMALVVLAHSVSTMMVFDAGPRMMLGGQLVMYGLSATEKYEREGKAAADSYLALLERTTRTHAYLFDRDANQIAGREPSPTVKEMARTMVEGGDDVFNQTARTDFVGKTINTAAGNRFIIVSESQRPTGIRLPFWPRVWWA
ncbi:MAG TPA: hypothetical protein VFV34_09730, partial [Blastocatellia bacterium]|nr:hypothetical protein [Blastocatellia bacterium]